MKLKPETREMRRSGKPHRKAKSRRSGNMLKNPGDAFSRPVRVHQGMHFVNRPNTDFDDEYNY